MRVDDIELLAALMREPRKPQKDILNEEKVKVDDEIHQWLRERQGEKDES